MEKSSFFNADLLGYDEDGMPKYDRTYLAEDFAGYFNKFIGNGVFPNPATNLQVVSNDNMTVTLKKGSAWINGYMYENTDDLIFDIDVADGALNRIDRLVLRLDILERRIYSYVKKGVFASTPTAPTLQRDVDVYELGIADIYVRKGAISILPQDITDLRLSTELCGIVHGVVDQVDTEVLFQDYQNWINTKKAEFNTDLIDYKTGKQADLDDWYTVTTTDFKNDFNTWFITIKEILDTNVAGNLLTKIEEVREEINNRNLPLNAKTYNEVSQWSDILIPDQLRGKALLEFLLSDESSSLQITNSEQAMLIIMQEERFDKARQVPFDYDQIIYKLGQKTDVGQYLAWVEELLSDHTRGVEKLELGLMLESGSLEISSNKYAMNVIMAGEELKELLDYRVKFASKSEFNNEIIRTNSEVDRLTVEINKKANK